MEPVPETTEAIEELTRYGDTEVADSLVEISTAVRELAPDCVGLSLTLVHDRLTFTMAATGSEIADLDAVQYVDGGPCVDAAASGHRLQYVDSDPLDEKQWQMFSRATAANGVASTLSLPIVRHGVVVAGVNLYGGTPDAFDGRHGLLALACGAWAEGAVTNADLSLQTRRQAAEAPERLRAQNTVDLAVGLLASAHGVDVVTAHDRIETAADRAGVPVSRAAELVIALLRD